MSSSDRSPSATTRGIDGTGKGTEAWASQPGMIRVYGNAGADAFYKLYSSNKMILTAAGGDLSSFNPQSYTSTDDCYSQWNTAPALWTDLNAPVMVRNTDPTDNNTVVPRFPSSRSAAGLCEPGHNDVQGQRWAGKSSRGSPTMPAR